jgi:hypothetical protein
MTDYLTAAERAQMEELRRRDPFVRETLVCSQNRIRSKSAWGHGDLPQKPRFSWSERYLGSESRTGRRPGPQTQDHSDSF